MNAIFTVLAVLLMLFNLLGGIVSAVWLVWLGEWWALGYGLLVAFVPMVLGIVLMPGLLMAGPAALLLDKGKTVAAFPLILLSQLYTYSVMGGWCLFVLNGYMSRATPESFWPLLIWSYGVALAPWMYLAQKEQNVGSLIATVTTQVAYLTVAAMLAASGALSPSLTIVFIIIMLLGMSFQAGFVLLLMRGGPPVQPQETQPEPPQETV